MTDTGAGPAGGPGAPAKATAAQQVRGLDLAAFGAYFTAAYPGAVCGPLQRQITSRPVSIDGPLCPCVA